MALKPPPPPPATLSYLQKERRTGWHTGANEGWGCGVDIEPGQAPEMGQFCRSQMLHPMQVENTCGPGI